MRYNNGATTNPPKVDSKALWRLAQFDPSCTDEYGHQALDYLVLDALALHGTLAVTAEQIASAIQDVYHIAFEPTEIASAGRHLRASGLVSVNSAGQHASATYTLDSRAANRMRRNLQHVQELEKAVLQGWRDELQLKYSEYPTIGRNLDALVEALQGFMTEMFYQHGVECVALLYPEDPKTRAWLGEVGDDLFSSIPQDDSFTSAVARFEVPAFFLSNEPQRQEYVTSLLNSSFFWHLMQVDEECSRLLKDVVSGQQLYLDNNVIYSLVGFHGADMLASVNHMLQMATELGYSLAVTTKTVDEFHGSLKYQIERLKSRPAIPADLARVASAELGATSFLTVYWEELAAHGTGIEEFVAERTYLTEIFEGLGIATTGNWREEIEESERLRDEKETLRQVSPPWVSDRVLEHDAFHRIFIERMRGRTPYHYSEATAWFLTHDTKLPHYSRIARKGSPQLPFCLTAEQWIQLNRPMLKRTKSTEDLKESFHVLVTEPFLRSMMAPFPMEDAYSEVLGRLARYKHMTPQLALDVVTQKQFMFSVATQMEATPAELDIEIESQLVELADRLRREKTDAETKLTEAIAETDSLRMTISASRRFHRWLLAGGLFLASSCGVWFHHLFWSSSYLHTHPNSVALKTALNLFLLAILLNIPLPRHWAVWVSGVFSLVALIIALLVG